MLNSEEMLQARADVMVEHRVPTCIRSDNGAEVTTHRVRNRLAAVGGNNQYLEPGCPWENGCNESCNGKLRDELSKGEIRYTLKEAQMLLEDWSRHDSAPLARLPTADPRSDPVASVFTLKHGIGYDESVDRNTTLNRVQRMPAGHHPIPNRDTI